MIKTKYRGFRLQKIEVNTQTRSLLDLRKWYAMYERRSDGVIIEAFSVSPEDAALYAHNKIDAFLANTEDPPAQQHFSLPSRVAGEQDGEYVWRVMQVFEEWANKIAREKLS